jgi:sigma-B regulation protein RsbQ
VPTLVIVGQEDTIAPPEVAHTMAAALPRARLALIPLAGHTPSVERPIPTAEAILAFLRESFPPPRVAIKLRPA